MAHRPANALAGAIPLLLAVACALPEKPSTAAAEQMEAMRELKREQEHFNSAKSVPQKLEFPGQGQITITQLSLDGFPDNVYVRARWHYQNNTGKPIVRAIVALDVLDPDGHVVASRNSRCIFPSIRPIYDGTFFSDELRTETRNAHLHPGWTWRMTCKAEYQDEEALEHDRKAEAREQEQAGQRGNGGR